MSIQSEYNKERARINRYISKLERAGAIVEFEIPSIPKRITPASVRRLQRITPDKILEKTSVISSETGEYRTGRGVLGTIQRKEQFKEETQKQREVRKKAEWDEYYRQKELQKLKSETQKLVDENAKQFEPTYPKQEDIIYDNVIDEFTGFYDEEQEIIYEDTSVLDEAISDLRNFSPDIGWNRWFTDQKRKQVNKLLKGISQAVNEKGKNTVAREFNENASGFNAVIDSAINDSGGDAAMEEIDSGIDELIDALMGAMSYEDAEFYGE